MTTEYVLLLAIYTFLILGAFLGDKGPMSAFKDAGPRLGARVERNLTVGTEFKNAAKGGEKTLNWFSPE
jgi:hypothetical protein